MKKFWCEVYLDRLYENLNIIRNLAEDKKVIAVVKGNAYGLGLDEMTKYMEEHIDYFAVADIDEAERIETEKKILLLSPLVTSEDFKSSNKNIIFTIDNREIIDEIPEEFEGDVQLYIDTGMSRMGIKMNEIGDVLDEISKKRPNVNVDGIYTHLHNTKNLKYTLHQIEQFKNSVMPYRDKVNMIHCMNSSGFINDEIRKACSFTDAVRAGNILYGYEGQSKGLKRIYNYYAEIVNVYDVKKGQTVGYGCSYKVKRDMKIGILGFGNIEHFGFSKDISRNLFIDVVRAAVNRLRFRPEIFVNDSGRGLKIVSRPNMNITIIDMQGISKNDLLRVEISPILADSRIEKRYIL